MAHPMAVAKSITRVGFGIALALVGVAHYMDAGNFAFGVGSGLEFSISGVEIDWLARAAWLWGWLMPGLMIVGGVFVAFGFMPQVGALLAGLALLSIPAGLMLKSVFGLSLDATMPPAQNAIVWILFYLAAVKGLGMCCGGACSCKASSEKSVPAKAPVAPKPVMIAKAPAKKAVAKKK